MNWIRIRLLWRDLYDIIEDDIDSALMDDQLDKITSTFYVFSKNFEKKTTNRGQ